MKTFVFYKIKDIRNLEDILDITSRFGIRVVIISREESDISFKLPRTVDLIDEKEFIEKFKDKKILVVETIGDKLLYEAKLEEFDMIMFGSEDEGVDICFLKNLKNVTYAKIPFKKGSYNLTSVVGIVVSEMILQKLENT